MFIIGLVPANTKENLFGVGEPLKSSNVNDFEEEKVVELVSMLNANSYRMWFGNDIFNNWSWTTPLDSFVVNESTKETYDKILDDLREAGVEEVTGMGHYLPVTDSTVSSSGNCYYVPHIGTQDYQIFLDKIYEIWYIMALTFPQIPVWEVGNETNNTHYFKYSDYSYMSYSEMAMINTDMIYYAYQGIKNANPNAVVITPGFAPVTSYYSENTNTENENIVKLNNGINSVEIFLKYLYGNIASGNYPYHNNSKYIDAYDNNPDNYFDGLAWHPYDLGSSGYANSNDPNTSTFDVNLWIDANNACYKVMCNYGDAGKEVWFTEFGLTTKSSNLVYSLTSSGDPYEYYIYYSGGRVNFNDGTTVKSQNVEAGYYYINFLDYETYSKNQEEFIREYFDAMESSEMPYVHACHFFRLFSSSIDYTWNGLTVLYYGIFTEAEEYLNRGYYPTHKAYVIQDIYGGIGDISKYSTYSSVHSGDVVIYDKCEETFDDGYLTGLSGNTVKYKGAFYAYSSNNNGSFSLDNGVLAMESSNNAYIAFKLNKFELGKTYTISFEMKNFEDNSALMIFSSDVSSGSWDNNTRLILANNSTSMLLSSLSVNDNIYSYTFTANEDYETLYFAFRNNGNISFESIKVDINN